MDSSELYHQKQQFLLGAYKSVLSVPIPDVNSPDYTTSLILHARSHLALGDPASALSVLPQESENVAIKAARHLAVYFASSNKDEEKDTLLEPLRDLCVEIEGDDAEGDERDKGMVRVLAGTAFVSAGETEEALESLGAGTQTENLEAVAVIIHIYLLLSRPDLARAQFEAAKKWAEDDLLLQLIESAISLSTGRDAYHDAHTFYTEQLANPSLAAPHVLVARGVARLLRGEVTNARSDLEQAAQDEGRETAEVLAAMAVAAGLDGKKSEAEEWWTKLLEQHPTHPPVVDFAQKAEAFDTAAAAFTVPPVASAA